MWLQSVATPVYFPGVLSLLFMHHWEDWEQSYPPLNAHQSNKEGSHMWCTKSISSSVCPKGCTVYFLSCASWSADMNKHCHLYISVAYRVCRLFPEGGAYWQNKLYLEIVMLSWSLKVQVIFKSMNLLTRILANWSWAQAQAGVTAAAKKQQKIHDQPVPFSNFKTCVPAPKQRGCWTSTFGALATHSV